MAKESKKNSYKYSSNQKKNQSSKFGAGTIFGIVIGLFVVVSVIAIIVNANNKPDPNVLTKESPTHPHTFGYAPDGQTLWIGTHTGMYEYNEGKWIRTVPAIQENDVMGYYVNANDPKVMYISGHGFVQRTEDGGASWKPIENGMPNAPKPDVPDAHILAQDPNDSKHLYVFLVQQENNVYETKDGGDTWNLAGTIAPDAYSMSVAPGGNALLVASEAGLRQYSFGENKNDVIAYSDKPVYSTYTLPNGEVFIYGPEGLQRTQDFKTWKPVELDLGAEQAIGIRASHADPNRLAVVTFDYTVHESTDGGNTWTRKK